MIRLAVRVPRDRAELVLAELLELAPGGVEEVDRGAMVEYALYGAPGELPALPELRAAAGGGTVEVVTEDVPEDWRERWRAFHRPVAAGPFRIRPPWADPAPGALDLVIDPGQAFGTGAHPTTRLCLSLLAALPAGGPLIDLGAGSGVLAIAAARLGFTPVLALDHDPAAVRAVRENARRNRVAVDVRRLDLRREDPPAAPTVVANLLRPLLLGLAGRVRAQRAVLSGLLREEVDEVASRWTGFEVAAHRVEGDWAAVALARGEPGQRNH